jgi:hypothetical protein
LKKLLIDDIYGTNNLKEILKERGYNNPSELINNYNLSFLGYKIKSNYILKKEISSVEDYLKEKILNLDFFKPNNTYMRLPIFYNIMIKLTTNLDVFKISDSEYITFTKLKKLGISKEDLFKIRAKIVDILRKEKYISIDNVRDILETTTLNDFGFDDIFYESLIGSIAEVNVLRINNNKIFSVMTKHMSRASFIESIVKEFGAIDIDELSEVIMKRYNVEVPYYKLKEYVVDTKLYFDKTLEKLYVDKKDYYEEVYYE